MSTLWRRFTAVTSAGQVNHDLILFTVFAGSCLDCHSMLVVKEPALRLAQLCHDDALHQACLRCQSWLAWTGLDWTGLVLMPHR